MAHVPQRRNDPPAAAAAPDAETLLARIRAIAAEVAAPHSADVDVRGRFPEETFAALREAGALSAAVPAAYGGSGCGMAALADQCAALAQGCGASGMVLAMHHIQVACLVRHTAGSAYFAGVLRELCERQLLLASVTSEVGVGGDTRSSRCAVIPSADAIAIDKDATTISYAEHSHAMLITARRDIDAASSDQVIVYAPRIGLRLEKTANWDPMGMRGTCSPGFRVRFDGRPEQVVPVPYADVSALTMVPSSHILWSGVWTGIAADAVARASAFVRAEARRTPGTVPPMASRLAEVSVELQTMRHHWQSLAREFDRLALEGDGGGLATLGWALKMNNLKIASSEAAPRIVHRALQVIGIQGYRNDSRYAVGRQYRDVLSASLMVANERIASKTATMLLIHKDD
jgi:acyl-CoA dehydrogenase